MGDIISKLNPVSGNKDEYLYRVQVLHMKQGGNRLKAAEELLKIAEGREFVFGCYEGYIVILHFGKDKNRIEKQILIINGRLINENGDVNAYGTGKYGLYRDIESLYIEAARNIDDGFLRVKEYLIQNYSRQELSLQIVADELNMNKRMVGKYISDYCGLMFKAYLNEIRIRAAREKLRKTNMRIQEVAYACGYMNVEHFTRIFTEKTSCSPSQYAVLKKEKEKE